MQLRLVVKVSFSTCQDHELTTVKFEKPGAPTLGFFISTFGNYSLIAPLWFWSDSTGFAYAGFPRRAERRCLWGAS